MIILATWCPNCSWWLLPLIFLSWLLGYLFWNSFSGGKLKNSINKLTSDVSDLKNQKTALETDLATSKYEYEKVNSDKVTLFNQSKTWEEKYNKVVTSTPDISSYDAKIADLEAQLEVARNSATQLESNFEGLKKRYGDLEAQLQVASDPEPVDVSKYTDEIDDLKRQLDAAYAANTRLKSDYSTLQLTNSEMESKFQSSQNTSEDLEAYTTRISDLEQLLSIQKNTNAEWEANYANLKSDFGKMELQLQAAQNSKPNVDISAYNARIEQLKQQLEMSESSSKRLQKDFDALKLKYDASTTLPLVTKTVKKRKKPAVVKEDDLTKIEGIGPKIEMLLKDAKIRTWKQLSKTPTPKLIKILNDAGPRYKMHNPGTWAQQALMAAEGKWDELKEWQDRLDGGK